MATKWQIENRERWLAWQREYDARNRERKRAYAREHDKQKRLNDPEWREKKNAQCKQWHLDHKDTYQAQHRERYHKNAAAICARQGEPDYRLRAAKQNRERRAANPEKYKRVAKLYRDTNPEKIRVFKLNEWARKKGAAGKVTVESLKARFDFHGNRCIYCGSITKLTIDHMIPLVRNGTNWPSNLAPACRSCNSRKHDKTYHEFMNILRREASLGWISSAARFKQVQ